MKEKINLNGCVHLNFTDSSELKYLKRIKFPKSELLVTKVNEIILSLDAKQKERLMFDTGISRSWISRVSSDKEYRKTPYNSIRCQAIIAWWDRNKRRMKNGR